MQPLSTSLRLRRAPRSRRGAALMLSLLVLFVLVAIVFQINIATSTDARVGRNDVSLTTMDLAIESAMLEVFETLALDGEDDGGGDGGPLGGGGGGADALGGAGEGGEASGPVDSRQDEWARPLRTEINRIQLRIVIQDEDSKYNLLAMLTEDEDEAEKALDRVARILDACREGTREDIDGGQARQMAEAMAEHLRNRPVSFLPRPALLSDEEELEDLGLPLSVREFVVLEGFEPHHFRDHRDSEGTIVHSIGSFLTVLTSLSTVGERDSAGGEADETGGGGPAGGGGEDGPDGGGGGELGSGLTGDADAGDSQGGEGVGGGPGGGDEGGSEASGVAVNINTAPLAVLASLMDDRDVPRHFWDDVLEYRNEEDEEAMGDDEEEPPLDEFGDPILVTKIFESLEELVEFDAYRNLEPVVQAELDQLLTVKSNVFSIFLTARRPTGTQAGGTEVLGKEDILEEEELGQALVRTVRCVVWRRQGDDGVELVPLQRWEVIDYLPFEVLDYPDEDR